MYNNSYINTGENTLAVQVKHPEISMGNSVHWCLPGKIDIHFEYGKP